MCLRIEGLEHRRLAKGEHLGFEFEIVYNTLGARCGYIRVLRGHPWFELEPDVDVHGSFTFAAHGRDCDSHAGDEEWWLGFDCSHIDDLPDPELPTYNPTHAALVDQLHSQFGAEVRSQGFVLEECFALARAAHNAVAIAP